MIKRFLKKTAVQRVLLGTGMVVGVAITIGLAEKPQQYQAPLFDNLGDYQWEVTTVSEAANKFFTQGMVMSFGFNHGEASRSFREAIRLDSTIAMGYWGLAYVLGPNYNAGMSAEDRAEVLWAVEKAKSLKQNLKDWEVALIDAIRVKFPADASEAKEEAFSEALALAYEKFPKHPEITVLYAESIMNLHAWDLYEKKGGAAKPWTPEIVRLLEEAMNTDEDHPLANHLYIHATEASTNPEKAYKSAEKLAWLVPGSGHLVHMPSHVYINTGDYHLGSLANEQAVKVDSAYIAQCKVKGVYPQLYYPHNYHFLAATAALEGRGARSIEAAFTMADVIDRQYLGKEGYETVQHYITVPYNVLVKFAQWEKILALNAPDPQYKYPVAIWHYAKGMAYANKGRMYFAKEELAKLQKLAADEEVRAIPIWEINTAADVVELAVEILAAEIAVKEKKWIIAEKHYLTAIDIEDHLNYNEPPDWFFSVRHPLGDMYIRAGEFKKAEKAFREDLSTFPRNGFALNGLYHALKAQSKNDEAKAIKVKMDKAWSYADCKLEYARIDESSRQDLKLKIGQNSPNEIIYLAGRYCGL
ncbi:MAG: hypothetical protein KI790_16425 [Cyclobacteriaceae bacterium]|nr:hypothetical protein [Cyclobacteriaceae bacterium HetDA_MAG_MS6]